MPDPRPKRSPREEWEVFLSLYHGIVETKGWRRLSVAIGGLSAVAVIVAMGWALTTLPGPRTVNGIVFVIVALSLAVPWHSSNLSVGL